jgi:site-specific DNA-methyltransferase (adenine-specific)
MINFFNTDNIDFMRQKPDKFYDLAIIDPPYQMVGNTFCTTSKQFLKNGAKGMHLDSRDTVKIDLGNRPSKNFWDELFRVSKNQIVFGMQYFTNYLPPHQCVIVWDKMNGESRFSDAEIIWTSFDLGTRIIKEYNKPKFQFQCGTIDSKSFRRLH